MFVILDIFLVTIYIIQSNMKHTRYVTNIIIPTIISDITKSKGIKNGKIPGLVEK